MVDVRAMLFSLYGMMDVLSELGCSLALFRNEEGKYEALLGMHLTSWGQSALMFVVTPTQHDLQSRLSFMLLPLLLTKLSLPARVSRSFLCAHLLFHGTSKIPWLL